jgi:hypothetical protein
MRRVDDIQRVLFHAKLASEIRLVVEVSGSDDALVRVGEDLEARADVGGGYDLG